MTNLADDIVGGTSIWSELTFDLPIGATKGGLYLVFEFPGSRSFETTGEGGGAAFGYYSGETGTPGWISGDGEFWLRLHEDSSFALLPVLVPLEEGMELKSFGPDDGEIPDVVEPYFLAGPNPFNPAIQIRFGLSQSSKVKLDIFNHRGARVTCLVNETKIAGHHVVRWAGVDVGGRKVASGSYFAHLRTDEWTKTLRMMLIK